MGLAGPPGPQGPAGPEGKVSVTRAAASLVVSPGAMDSGRRVGSIQGSGFEAYEKVAVVLVKAAQGQDLVLAEATANLSGAFYIEGTEKMGQAMGGIPPGDYTVKATGTAGSLATAPLRISEPKKP